MRAALKIALFGISVSLSSTLSVVIKRSYETRDFMKDVCVWEEKRTKFCAHFLVRVSFAFVYLR